MANNYLSFAGWMSLYYIKEDSLYYNRYDQRCLTYDEVLDKYGDYKKDMCK